MLFCGFLVLKWLDFNEVLTRKFQGVTFSLLDQSIYRFKYLIYYRGTNNLSICLTGKKHNVMLNTVHYIFLLLNQDGWLGVPFQYL